MASKGNHDVSDSDSDITVGPDDIIGDSPQKPSPALKQPSLTKRRSEVHEISDSEEESEEFFILKGKKRASEKKSHSGKQNTSSSETRTDTKNVNVKPSKSSIDTVAKSPIKGTIKSSTDIEDWLNKIEHVSSKNSPKTDNGKNENQSAKTGSKISEHSAGLKRKQTVLLEEEKSTPSKKQPPCQYGSKCYRKNPSHFEEYSHPGIIV